MGTDKALLDVDGVPLGRRAIDALREAGVSEVVAVGGTDAHAVVLGVEVVPDAVAGEGPVGGVITALRWADGEPVVVLPCDLPAVTAAALAPLVGSPLQPDTVRVAARDGRMAFPIGVWPPDCLDVLETAFVAGIRSFRGALAGALLELVEVGPELDDADDPGSLARLRYPAGP